MSGIKPNLGAGKHGRSGRRPTTRNPDEKQKLITFAPNKVAEQILDLLDAKYIGDYLSKAIIEYERNNSFRYDEEN